MNEGHHVAICRDYSAFCLGIPLIYYSLVYMLAFIVGTVTTWRTKRNLYGATGMVFAILSGMHIVVYAVLAAIIKVLYEIGQRNEHGPFPILYRYKIDGQIQIAIITIVLILFGLVFIIDRHQRGLKAVRYTNS